MNYYGKEDEVQQTTTVALDNLRAQQNTLAAVDQFADETLESLRQQFHNMWNEAHQRGDIAIQNELTSAFDHIQKLQRSLKINNSALKNVLEVAQALGQQKATIENQLDETLEAIYDEDLNHPILKGLVNRVRVVTTAEVEESAFEKGLDRAYGEVWDEVSKGIKNVVPNSYWSSVYHLVAAFNGQEPLNDIQRGLLISLLQTFEVEVEAAAS